MVLRFSVFNPQMTQITLLIPWFSYQFAIRHPMRVSVPDASARRPVPPNQRSASGTLWPRRVASMDDGLHIGISS
jgi:hypothetical protein